MFKGRAFLVAAPPRCDISFWLKASSARRNGTKALMIGTTRSRVNFFMNKFKKLGFIEHKCKLHVNASLLSIVLHDLNAVNAAGDL